MSFFNKYPYLDEHELNLDWLLAKMRKLEIDFDEFKVVNNITFSGAWDITKQYPAWTIVNDNNIGYVSIQPVPVGVVLTNTDYWVEVIDYSAQIAGLQNRVVALETTVGDSSSGLVKDVDDLQAADITINKRITNTSHIANDYPNKKIIFMGDSYGEGAICVSTNPNTYTRNYADGWMSKLINYLGMDAAHAIALPTGGASFALQGGQHWQDLIAAQADDDDVCMIVVCGGANDFPETEADIVSGIDTFFSVVNSKFPNAIVVIGMIGFSRWGSSVLPYQKTWKAYHDGAIKNGGVFIPGAENVMHHIDNFSLDGLHGSADGYTKIAQYLYNFFITGSSEYFDSSTSTFTPSIAGGTVGTLGECASYIHNGSIKFKLALLNLSMTPFSCTLNGNFVDLGTVDSCDIIGRSGYGVVTPCELIYLDNNDGFLFTHGYARLIGNVLSVAAYVWDSGNYKTLSACKAIQIFNASFDSNTLDVL